MAGSFVKVAKATVDYGPGKPEAHCGICKYFIEKDGKCRRVIGEVEADMWCKLFKREKA
jgi:hypothetical protein